MMIISAAARREIAQAVGASEPYLYQCLSGRKLMRPEEAVRIERDSGGRVRRWHLRRTDWHLIWPELIGTEGAPEPPGGGADIAQPATEAVAGGGGGDE
jgi:DNA-binding transcriptional regulator YdaS (Cro superfamily)